MSIFCPTLIDPYQLFTLYNALSGYILIVPMKHFLLVFALILAGGAALQAQNKSLADLSVFPNPTSDYISVKDNNDAVGFIAVFNLIGKKVKEFDFVKGEQYYVADLTKGMYLVQILDRNKQTLTTQKLNKR